MSLRVHLNVFYWALVLCQVGFGEVRQVSNKIKTDEEVIVIVPRSQKDWWSFYNLLEEEKGIKWMMPSYCTFCSYWQSLYVSKGILLFDEFIFIWLYWNKQGCAEWKIQDRPIWSILPFLINVRMESTYVLWSIGRHLHCPLPALENYHVTHQFKHD